MNIFSRKINLFLSLLSVLIVFFMYWGGCIVVMLVVGKTINNAFPNKGWVLAIIVALQVCMFFSYPIRQRFHVWLRLCVVGYFFIYPVVFIAGLRE